MSSRRVSDVFLDVCTQHDYLDQTGARPTLNATRLTPNVKHLIAYARWARVPVLSCVDGARVNQVQGRVRPTCVFGSNGQRKIRYSLLPDRVIVDVDNYMCVPLDIIQQHQQTILFKEHRDPFTNPKLDRLLTEVHARRFVVFGVALETSLRLLVLGLLLRHHRVTLVTDACGYWDPNDADMALRQLAAKGCEMLTTRAVVERGLAVAGAPNGQQRRRRSRWVA